MIMDSLLKRCSHVASNQQTHVLNVKHIRSPVASSEMCLILSICAFPGLGPWLILAVEYITVLVVRAVGVEG